MNTRESVTVVVYNDDLSKVLLQKREDFRIWGLPAGRIEPGEDREEAGVRETLEETGYHVDIVDYVGAYRRPQLPSGGDTNYVFTGTVTGGSSDNHGWETVAVDWFRPDNLPNRMVGFARDYIADSLKKPLVPVEKTHLIPHWKARLFQLAFALRGLRNKILGRP